MKALSDEKILWAAVLASPRDLAPRLALLDLLIEQDADDLLISGLQWCLDHGKWPKHKVRSKPPFFFVRQLTGFRSGCRPGRSTLPADIYRFMPTQYLGYWDYEHHDCAGAQKLETLMRRLGRALFWYEGRQRILAELNTPLEQPIEGSTMKRL